MMTNLSVNLNKVALLRNQRDVRHPDVLRAAHTAIRAGAQGITVHPRPDERHIRFDDVVALARLLGDEYGGRIEFNIEGYPSDAFINLIHRVCPTQTTLVPDRPDVVTSDEGWNFGANASMLRDVIRTLSETGTRIALFVEPDVESIRYAQRVGADRIELFTAHFARAFGTDQGKAVLARYVRAATLARDLGLGTNAGHDLNLDNLPPFRRAIPWVLEVSIGHALTTDALEMGLGETVKAYLAALQPEAF